MIDQSQVTACLVTRGDQPEAMQRIRESLICDRLEIWDNSEAGNDLKTAGRYMAAECADTEIVYFQDDDVIVPAATQQALLDAYEPGVVVANWGHGQNPDGYDDLPLVCGGAILDRRLCRQAILRYALHQPLDDWFLYDADFAVGVLYPAFRHVHLPFEIDLAIAQHPSRLCNQPWQREAKLTITGRARAIRDGARLAA
jgi:hypothetical protein